MKNAKKVAELERQAEAFHANKIFNTARFSLGVILISLILARNNRQSKSKYFTSTTKEEIDQKSYELEKSLIQIKSTQAQLIQSEKMASPGRANRRHRHEIQNPLIS